MRYSDFLKKNGKIGFIAPSFGCTTEPYRTYFDNALRRFEEKGYSTVLGPNCYEDCGIGISNTPKKCGEEVNDFFINDKSDVIISCGGGELMCEDLEYIDFDGIKNAVPKWYMGFSDNTNLTFLLNTICDIASIYGPNAPKFGTDPIHECVSEAFEVISGERLSAHNYDVWFQDDPAASDDEADSIERSYIEIPYKQYIFDGDNKCDNVTFTGRLIGGCMDCLRNLIGTPYDNVSDFCEKYRDDGIIWFLEACDLHVMDIRRTLWHMENAGWFKNVKGFVLGRPMHFDDTFGDFDHIEAAKGILGKYNVPIVMDTDIGHLFPMMPIISGSVGTVTAIDNTISIKYDLV